MRTILVRLRLSQSRTARPWSLSLCVLLLGNLAFLAVTRAQAATNAPPDRLSYQGYLVDANDEMLAPTTPENYTIVFKIWSAPTGGTLLWAESQEVTVDKGNFSVVLGEGVTPPGFSPSFHGPLSSVLGGNSTASDRYIGITVTIDGTATDILPRLRLLPTPYAFLATSARQLTDTTGSTRVTYKSNRVEVTGNFFASGSITGTIAGNGASLTDLNASRITSGTLATARIPTLTTTHIPNLPASKITSGTLSTNQIPNLPASQITSGTLSTNQIPILNVSKIPNLNASKIDAGTFHSDRIPTTLSSDRVFNAKVGIGTGTTTPNVKLHVQGKPIDAGLDNGSGILVLGSVASGQANLVFDDNEIQARSGTTTAGDLYLQAEGGRVGIGTLGVIPSPSDMLFVKGNLKVDGQIWKSIDGTYEQLLKWTDEYAYWSSDARLKEQIATIPSAVETVGKLRGVTWRWNELGLQRFTKDVEANFKSDSGRPEDDEKLWAEKRREITAKQSKVEFGFVAQEVEKVFPDWVTTAEDGYKQINMERLSAVLVNAIKEQQEQIEALETAQAGRLAALQAQNEGWQRQVAELTAQLARRDAQARTVEERTSALELMVRKLTQAQAATTPGLPDSPSAGLVVGLDVDLNR